MNEKLISEKIGEIEWGFFYHKKNPLPSTINISQLKNIKIIGSTYIDSEKLREVFPFDHHNKHQLQFSHCAETSITSMMIASESQDLVYLPKILIRTLGFEDRFREIKIKDLPGKKSDVYISCQIDRLKKNEFELIKENLIHAL